MANVFTLFGELKANTRQFHNALRDADGALFSTAKIIDTVEFKATNLGNKTAVSARGFEKLRDAVAQARERLFATAAAFERGEASAEDMRKAFINVEKATERMNSKLKDTSARLEDVQKKTLSVHKGIETAASGLTSFGTALSAAVTVPILGLGAASIKSAADIDSLRVKLIAATGSVESANAKFAELRKLAMDNAGVMTGTAIATFAFLKPMKLTDDVINQVITAFGKLKSANPDVDLQRMGQNIAQLFGQDFEMQDLKEAVGNFPRFGEILKKTFNLQAEAGNLKALKEELKGLKDEGLTQQGFFEAIAKGINTDDTLSRITDSIPVRFEKMVERIKFALEPLGLVLVGVLEKWIPPIAAFIERVSNAFNALSPTMQTVVVVFGAAAAAAGPLLIALGAVVTAIAGIVANAAVIGVVVGAIAGLSIALAPVIAMAPIFYKAWSDNWDLVVQIFNQGFEKLKAFWNEHSGVVTAAWEAITSAIQSGAEIASKLLRVALQVIAGDWEGAWQTYLVVVEKAWAAITKFLQAAIPIAIKVMIEFGLAIVRTAVEWGVKLLIFLQTLPLQIIRLVPTFLKAGLEIGRAVWEGIKSGLSGVQGIQAGVSASIIDKGMFDNLLKQFTSTVNAAGGGGNGTGPIATFLSPIKTDAVQTVAALDRVKQKVAEVKAAVAPVMDMGVRTATINGYRQYSGHLADAGKNGTYSRTIQSIDTPLSDPNQSTADAYAVAMEKALTGALKKEPQKLEITVLDPWHSISVKNATPMTTNLRYAN